MIRKLLTLVISTVFLLILTVYPVQAAPFTFSLPWFQDIEFTEEQQNLMEQLEAQYIPQIETILTPKQREKFEHAIEGGFSLRKAFKSMALSVEQKSELATALKSFPKKDLFATLTSEQKKEVFMKKKEMFMPTAEEITERINAGMKQKEMFAPASDTAPSAEEISAKIKAGLEKKKAFMPTLEEIKDKIAEKVEAIVDEE
ncbi:MAG: hypothetical protein Kow00121_68380 [Elainellaceae cyanobacterium]